MNNKDEESIQVRWPDNRPEYSNYKRVLDNAEWYEIYEIQNNTYAFYEPGFSEEVISFLLVGKKRALLWDTGMGFAPLRPLVEQLTSLPLTVINSHIHMDHVASNHEFDVVYAWLSEYQERSQTGYDLSGMVAQLINFPFSRPLSPDFIAEKYTVYPWKYARLSDPEQIATKDGFIYRSQGSSYPFFPSEVKPLLTNIAVDIGGRILDILHTPGHTFDSIMLLEYDKRTLYTGDTIYSGELYAHLPSTWFNVFSTFFFDKQKY